MTNPSSTDLAGDLMILLAKAPGRPPDINALTSLGGWERVASDGAAMADSAVLTPLVALVVQDAADPANRTSAYTAAMSAVTTAITRTKNPSVFADSLNTLLSCPAALAESRIGLATELEDIVRSFCKLLNPTDRAAQRAADALEGLTRLSLTDDDPPFDLFALLKKFDAPAPKPVAIAVIRAVGTVVDHWPHAASLARVVRLVAGMDRPSGAVQHDVDPEDVASDAAWALAGIELIDALRASDLAAMAMHLEASAAYLDTARDNYEREDADILLAVVQLLLSLLQQSGVPPTVTSLATPHLEPQALEHLSERVRRINVTSIGLNHWYGDPKRAALAAWSRLADDLGRLRQEFDRNSFYKAAVVVDHLLQIYVGSRSVEVVRREDDIDGLLSLVQPIIETGFARTAGLLSNLEDHTEELEQRVSAATTVDQQVILSEQLEAARAVLTAARSHALGGAGQGKGGGGTADMPLPPPLSQLVPAGSRAANDLGTLSEVTLGELARAIDDRTIGRRSLNLIETEIFSRIRAALASSPDYRHEAAITIDELLRIVIRFVTTRTNRQSDRFPYLFDPAAKEDSIHHDLDGYLTLSDLGSTVEYEVQHVAGGRIDLRLKFDGFAIHIEMKVDSTKVPMSDKTAYLKQAAAYQGTDIRIGFLVALRHKAFDPTGPAPHLSELIGHTTFDIEGDRTPRHIITVQVPGSRTKPSDMR
ncbi:hypothetical protein [Micromonospora chokoriensis]|uniref:hypothetical protein n=1 Tax=Micromonospora chokoriensis TaxID=356851 RepID=UPI000A7C8CDA|nr:hypothetical protein [Micromonospora chokoriensis]